MGMREGSGGDVYLANLIAHSVGIISVVEKKVLFDA
jgi:hypothetical protein